MFWLSNCQDSHGPFLGSFLPIYLTMLLKFIWCPSASLPMTSLPSPSLALVLQATKVAVTVCGYDLWPMAPVPFLRASVDRSVPQGAKVTTSEQLQPVYETKNLVQQNSKQLEGIELHLKVRVRKCWLLVCCSLVPSLLLCRGGARVWGEYNGWRSVFFLLLSNLSLTSLSSLQQLSAHQCPPPSDMPSCVSPLIFVVAIVAQLLLMWGYTFYQRIQEHNAKKFFWWNDSLVGK